jgi:site-specific DNA-cytosine methylase
MKILIACEESQAVTIEFRKLGFKAFSCDILDCSGGHPEWHIKGDVLKELNKGYDMMIAFPPCTHLAVSGARHFEEKRKDGRQQQGIDFFMDIVNAPIPRIAVENPVGIMSKLYKKPSQIIQPYYFGDSFQKTTCLWLKNLPPLYHNDKPNLFDDVVTHTSKGEFVTFKSGKRMAKWFADSYGDGHKRSKTFPGIAKAMAEQWSKIL